MASFPPSHPGSDPLTAHPTAEAKSPKSSVAANACRRTFLAPAGSLAPIRWATYTENPVAAAVHTPLKSHVVVDTSPMDAEAFAPRLPTIEASM